MSWTVLAVSLVVTMHCLLRNTSTIATAEAGTSLPAPLDSMSLMMSPEEALSRADQKSYSTLDSHSLALCSEVK